MDILYTAVMNRLNANKNLFTDEGVSPVLHIDYFKGQYHQPDEHDVFQVPAVFFEWSVNDWKNKGNQTQEGTATVTIHIVLENSASNAFGSSSAEDARKTTKYYELVHACLQGLSGACFSAFRRTSDNPDPTPPAHHAHLITYTSRVEDNSTLKYRDRINTEIEDMVVTGNVVVETLEDDEQEGGFFVEV